MAKFFVHRNFQFERKIYRTNDDGTAILKIGDNKLKAEIAKGKHPKTGKWMSPILNHCNPADNATNLLVNPEAEDKREDIAEDPSSELEAIKRELDELGKGYDNRWGLDRFRNELTKAKKEDPVAVEEIVNETTVQQR